MENLILSIVNKNYSDLDRFFISLKGAGYRGHTCIFAGPDSDPTLMAKLAADGVEIVRFETTFPYVANPHPDNFKSLPSTTILFNYRYFLFYDYLLKNPGRFANVLLTDIRDVVFQRDPFEIITTDALYVALENNTLDGCEYTKRWILAGYDQAVVDEVKPMRLSCSGTTLGPTAHIMRYLKAMVAEIPKLQDPYHCFCQGIHNVLLHTGQLEPTVRIDNQDGLIMTVGGHMNPTEMQQLHYDKQGYMLGKSDERVHIVHQFDRHVSIILQLDKFIFKSLLPTALSKRNFRLAMDDYYQSAVVGTYQSVVVGAYLKSPLAMRIWRSLKQAAGRKEAA
jgi:hypothetical protein